MNLKTLSNEELLAFGKNAARNEKTYTIQVIECIKEVYERSMYLESYPSMFEFMRKEFNYTEAEAHVRIQTAKLSVAIPEVTEKMKSGELSLSVAASTFSEFRKEDIRRKEAGEKPMRKEEKREVLAMVENCSRRQAEEKLGSYFAGPSDQRDYKFTAKKNLELKLEALFDEYSHINFDRDLGKLIEMLVDKDLARIEKKLNGPAQKKEGKVTEKEQQNGLADEIANEEKKVGKSQSTHPLAQTTTAQSVIQTNKKEKASKGSRIRLSIHTKREVWKKTDKMCTHVDPITGKRCSSKHAIEIDHIVPLAKGGSNDPNNLTILCDAHNRLKGAT